VQIVTALIIPNQHITLTEYVHPNKEYKLINYLGYSYTNISSKHEINSQHQFRKIIY